MRPHYSVVVVGSGYGGAITAARVAAGGTDVCVLERGTERRPGEYPETLPAAARAMRARTPIGDLGSRTGLWDLHLDRDMSVMVGAGLGGTSLVNAAVALRPTAPVFADSRWPAALREPGMLDDDFTAAEEMLGANPYPAGSPQLSKAAALQRTADAFDATIRRPPLAITFADGVGGGGLEQRACQLCGNCVAGCNYGSKNSVLMNYLPVAHRHGAHLVTEVDVRTVRPRPGGGWVVAFEAVGGGRTAFAQPSLFVTADVVVLSAGALGSTEILLRSAAAGLPVSGRLGDSFSGNGDVLAFAYDIDTDVHGIGDGPVRPADRAPVGPCITGLLDLTGPARPAAVTGAPGADRPGAVDLGGVAVEEGALPGALAAIVPAALVGAAAVFGTDSRPPAARARRLLRELAGVPRGAYRGAPDRTLTYLVMSPDDANGRLVLDTRFDRVAVDWKDVGDRPVFGRADRTLRHGAARLGGTYLPNPLWSSVFGHSLVTVHPLGGCVLADDAEGGVVNDRGQVFAGAGGTAVHDGLYVADGSIVPRALDANPLLTISALAERIVRLMMRDRGWAPAAAAAAAGPTGGAADLPAAGQVAGTTGGLAANAAAGPTETPADGPAEGSGPGGGQPAAEPAVLTDGGDGPPGLRFTERMAGFVSLAAPPDPESGWTQGRADGTSLEFVLTAEFDDIRRVLEDNRSPATLWGTVSAPWLSPHALRVTSGRLVLFEPVPSEVETDHMTYDLRLLAEDGSRYRLRGHKVLHERPGLTAWTDTTSLFVELHRDGTGGGALATGVLRISPADFARQMRTMRVVRARGVEALRYQAAFTRMFTRRLVRIYGGPLDEAGRFPQPTGAPAPEGPASGGDLPTPAPRWRDRAGRWHDGTGAGGDATLRLTRYQGGERGPVLLASGFGMSSQAFVAPTITTNLTSYLTGRGYDVWLFDYRAAIDLPTATTEFDLDPIATEDWPEAVAEVRRVTGAATVQAYGHCVGSVSLLMALGAGVLPDVRAAVAAQFPLHPVTSPLNLAKIDLHVGSAMAAVGLHVVAPPRRISVPNVAIDLTLRALPMARGEHCGLAVCRWINAIYGLTHRHAQLNDETHDALDGWFGVGNVTALRHLALMMKRGVAVDGEGRDVYTRHPERLALPIRFLQGTTNYIFRPDGTRRTVDWLSAANGPELYSRTLLPGYAHLDAVVGKNAATDVFPAIAEHLDLW